MAEKWWPDEGAHGGPEHLDPAYVEEFDRKSSTDWSATVESLAGLGIGPTSTVLDIGAGTGTFAWPCDRTLDALLPWTRRPQWSP